LDAACRQPLLIGHRAVLTAAIGMVQESHRHGALLKGHLERAKCHNRSCLLIHGPADKQHGHIEPALTRGYVSDVACPLLIRPSRDKLPSQGVRHHKSRRGHCGSFPGPASADAPNIMEPHQFGDSMTAHPEPLSLQILVNPRTAVPASRSLITGRNVHHQALVLLCAHTHRALIPGIEPTTGNVEHPTQYPHGIVRLLRLNESISHDDSLAKKATALFKMSRSMRYYSTSRRTTFSSSVARKL